MRIIGGCILIALFSCVFWALNKPSGRDKEPSHFTASGGDYSLSYGKEGAPGEDQNTEMAALPPQIVGTNVNPEENLGLSWRSSPIYYNGLCDASAVVALDQNYFVVGDDEDNVLRVYQRQKGGLPVFSLELSPFLRLSPKSPEVDIEAADRVGELIYWISSHGRTVKGKEAVNRHRFFATTGVVVDGRVDLKPVGQPYADLLRDMLGDPRLVPFRLGVAAMQAPKTPGALNIEGLSATPEGYLLIGFRNPIPKGRALVVPLLNPMELIAGKKARFGDPVLLDLGGRGIRSMTFWRGQYVIVGGSNQEGGESQFYLWDGKNAPQLLAGIHVGGLNPEAVAFWDEEGMERLYIVSDDGTQSVMGVECKKLKDSSLKRFRAVCLN